MALHGKPISEPWGVTCHMGSHSVTCHPTQVNAPALTPARQAGTRFTYPGGMEGWVDLGSFIAARPGIEPTTAWSQVRRPNRYAIKPPTTNAMRRAVYTIFVQNASGTRGPCSRTPHIAENTLGFCDVRTLSSLSPTCCLQTAQT